MGLRFRTPRCKTIRPCRSPLQPDEAAYLKVENHGVVFLSNPVIGNPYFANPRQANPVYPTDLPSERRLKINLKEGAYASPCAGVCPGATVVPMVRFDVINGGQATIPAQNFIGNGQTNSGNT